MYGHEDPLPQVAQPAQSAYSLNGTQLGTHTSGQSKANAALFFHASNLPIGTHTLTISVIQASNASSYYLDWVEYNVTLSSSQSSSITGPSSATSSPSASSKSAASGSRKTLPVGAIVGIAVGTALLLCCATLLLARKWRRRRATRLAGDFAYGPKGHYGECTSRSFSTLATDVDEYRRDAHRSGHGLIRERRTARILPRLGTIARRTVTRVGRGSWVGRSPALPGCS